MDKITLIAASVNPALAEGLRRNVAATAGSPYEIVIHDNRQVGWSLARIYNHYATAAGDGVLCFLHEDVLFLTEGWGEVITSFYDARTDAGVVGFLGSQLKTVSPSAIGCYPPLEMGSLRQSSGGNAVKVYDRRADDGNGFTPVATVDGLCMFVRRSVWAECPFDEATFDGFHLYDLDFCMAAGLTHTNYVCHLITVAHASEGSHNAEWYRYTRAFHDKWAGHLPASAAPLEPGVVRDAEAYAAYKFYKNVLDHGPKEYAEYARSCFNRYWNFGYWLRLIPHRLHLVKPKRR